MLLPQDNRAFDHRLGRAGASQARAADGVLGRRARRRHRQARARSIKKEKALDYVAGYLNVLDLSDATDQAQRRQDIYGSRFGIDWFRTKCFDGAAPMGPWITPAEDVPDPQNLALKTVTKGEVMQDSNTSNMVFTVAEQIEYLSERLTLRPGDVI